MSKFKKFVSFVLVVALLAGIGYCTYLLFSKKDTSLNKKRAINLVSETSKELNNAITTMGNGVSGNTNVSAISGASLNANASLNATSSTNMSDYVYFIQHMASINSFIEMIDFAFNMSSDTIEFDKIYSTTSSNSGDLSYFTLYYTEDSVIYESAFEMKNEDEEGTERWSANSYSIIDYDREKGKPAALNCIDIIEIRERSKDYETKSNHVLMIMSSINFDLKTFNYYRVGCYSESSSLTGLRYDLAHGRLTFDDIEKYCDFKGDSFIIYSGNIADNVDDIRLITDNDLTTTRKALFNTYSTNIKHLDLVSTSNSRINLNNLGSVSGVGSDVEQFYVASSNKYMCALGESDKLYFINATSFGGWQEWDRILINKLKTLLNEMDVSNVNTVYKSQIKIYISSDATPETEFALLKSTVDALENYYIRHKNDVNYVSIMFGKCTSEMDFPSVSSKVRAYIGSNDDESPFTYGLWCVSLGDVTTYPIDYSIRATLYIPNILTMENS